MPSLYTIEDVEKELVKELDAPVRDSEQIDRLLDVICVIRKTEPQERERQDSD